MNNLTIFESPEFGAIRTVELDGEPWFVGKDVATALGYSEPHKAISCYVDDKDKTVAKVSTSGGDHAAIAINETGVYSLALNSPLNNAKDVTERLVSYFKESANKPKVIFADAVSASERSILVGELAKLLRQNGVEIGQNRLFDWMRQNGFLIRRQGTDYNMPTQKAMEMGLFEIKETSVVHSAGNVTINKTPKVTGKGQVYFINRFLGRKEA